MQIKQTILIFLDGFVNSSSGANGMTDYDTRQVLVRTDMDPAAQVKTLAHELAHVLLHGPLR